MYVFCLHTEQDKAEASVLDVATWEFYVVPTGALNREFEAAKSISLAAVKRMAVACKWEGLKAAVDGIKRAVTPVSAQM